MLMSVSFHKPLILIHQRADRKQNKAGPQKLKRVTVPPSSEAPRCRHTRIESRVSQTHLLTRVHSK